MRVLLKEILDCPPDAAWRAIRSPAVFREVSSPLLALESLEADGFPTLWEPGEHPAAVRGLGLVPLGTQVIRLSERTRGDVRILRDSGRSVSGPLAAVTAWDHRMAIAPDPAGTGKTLYRDQLRFSAGTGAATLALWPGLWSFWQWRMRQIQRLAPGWSLDLGVDDPDFVPTPAR